MSDESPRPPDGAGCLLAIPLGLALWVMVLSVWTVFFR